jgi:hypothetical protein
MTDQPQPFASQHDPSSNSSGVGVFVVAPTSIKLPIVGLQWMEKQIPKGECLVGTRIVKYSPSAKGDIIWKLYGRVANKKTMFEYVIGDVEWESGTVEDYYRGLLPLPSSISMDRPFDYDSDLAAASDDALISATSDRDWVVRYRSYRELIKRKSGDPRLRAALNKWTDETVYIVSSLMNSGVYDLYENMQPRVGH